MNVDFVNNESREFWENLIYQSIHNSRAREILSVYLLDDGTYEGTAEICDVSTNTVYNKMHKYLPILAENYFKKMKKL